MKTRSILLFTVFLAFAFSCSPEEENSIDQDDQSVFQGEENLEALFDGIESVTFSALNYADVNASGRKAVSEYPEFACAIVGFSGNNEIGRIEINFGDGCEGPDGKVRKGKLVIEYTGHWLEPGATITTLTKDYFVDDLKVEGTRILTNISESMNELKYSVTITGGKITWLDGTFITRVSERTHTITFGDGFDDYILEVEGAASGTSRLGTLYETTTVEPLIYKSNCRGDIYLPTKGVKRIKVPERQEITVDYGSGDCDYSFTVSIGNYSRLVMLNK